jgi:chromosomal replication initiator protein
MADWDYRPFWNETIEQLRRELGEGEFTIWLSNLNYLKASETELSVTVPSVFFREQFRSRYHSRIEEKIRELSGKSLTISLEVAAREPQSNRKEEEKEAEPRKTAAQTVPAARVQTPGAQTPAAKAVEKKPHSLLQEEYTFETFVVGDDNKFAFNAAAAVARNPGTSKDYNPLLVYGSSGLGKTHLMQAIGHFIHANSDLKILYTTAEGFLHDFVEMVAQKKMPDFKKKYRNVDALLIDDIHTFEKGDRTQEELYYTFEALYNAKKQIVFTCDRPISELKNMAERLKTRFSWGLSVDLKPPDYETRIAILKKKMETKKAVVSDEIIGFISKNISSNVRDLEGALNKLTKYAELLKQPITMEIAQRELKDVFASTNQVSIETIIRAVADYFHLSPADIKGKKRSKGIVRARHIAMYLTRNTTEYSLTEIGQSFGDRDHSTVLVSCEKIENECRTDTNLDSIIQELKRIIKEYNVKNG